MSLQDNLDDPVPELVDEEDDINLSCTSPAYKKLCQENHDVPQPEEDYINLSCTSTAYKEYKRWQSPQLPPCNVDLNMKKHYNMSEDLGKWNGNVDVDWMDILASISELMNNNAIQLLMVLVTNFTSIKQTFQRKETAPGCRQFKDWLLLNTGPVYVMVYTRWENNDGICYNNEDALKKVLCEKFQTNHQVKICPSPEAGVFARCSTPIATKTLFEVLKDIFPVYVV